MDPAVDSFVGRRRPNVKETEIRFRPISFLSPTKVALWKSIQLAVDRLFFVESYLLTKSLATLGAADFVAGAIGL